MDLNINALEGLKLGGDCLYLSDADFSIVFNSVFEVLLRGKKAEDLLCIILFIIFWIFFL